MCVYVYVYMYMCICIYSLTRKCTLCGIFNGRMLLLSLYKQCSCHEWEEISLTINNRSQVF